MGATVDSMQLTFFFLYLSGQLFCSIY